MVGMTTAFCITSILNREVQCFIHPHCWVVCKLWINSETRRKCFVSGFSDCAQFVKRWPWAFWVDMIRRDWRNATPIVDARIEQNAKVVT